VRAAGPLALGLLASITGCDGATSLGALAPSDASVPADVVRARVAGPLRCVAAPPDEPGIRVDPAATPYAIAHVVEGPRGGPWVDGDAYYSPPSIALFLADPRCGVRVARYAIHIGTGPAVSDDCVVGTLGAVGVRMRHNGTNPGLCLQFGGDAPAFATALLDPSLTRATPLERSPGTAVCSILRDHREAAVGLDARVGRWFRRYGSAFAPVMAAAPLPRALEVVVPAALTYLGTWLSLWKTRTASGDGLRAEWIADDGEVRAFGSSPTGWFPGTSSVRLLTGREHEDGLLAVLRLADDRGVSLGTALLCPDDTVRTRRLVELDVERAVLRPYGPFFALFTQRSDGAERVIELTLLASDLSWRREPRELLRASGLALHDVLAGDQPDELLVWHSVPAEGGEQRLLVGILGPER